MSPALGISATVEIGPTNSDGLTTMTSPSRSSSSAVKAVEEAPSYPQQNSLIPEPSMTNGFDHKASPLPSFPSTADEPVASGSTQRKSTFLAHLSPSSPYNTVSGSSPPSGGVTPRPRLSPRQSTVDAESYSTARNFPTKPTSLHLRSPTRTEAGEDEGRTKSTEDKRSGSRSSVATLRSAQGMEPRPRRGSMSPKLGESDTRFPSNSLLDPGQDPNAAGSGGETVSSPFAPDHNLSQSTANDAPIVVRPITPPRPESFNGTSTVPHFGRPRPFTTDLADGSRTKSTELIRPPMLRPESQGSTASSADSASFYADILSTSAGRSSITTDTSTDALAFKDPTWFARRHSVSSESSILLDPTDRTSSATLASTLRTMGLDPDSITVLRKPHEMDITPRAEHPPFNARAMEKAQPSSSPSYFPNVADWTKSVPAAADPGDFVLDAESGIAVSTALAPPVGYPSGSTPATPDRPALTSSVEMEPFAAAIVSRSRRSSLAAPSPPLVEPTNDPQSGPSDVVAYRGKITIDSDLLKYTVAAEMPGFRLEDITIAVKSVEKKPAGAERKPGSERDRPSSSPDSRRSSMSMSSSSSGVEFRKGKCLHLVADRWDDGVHMERRITFGQDADFSGGVKAQFDGQILRIEVPRHARRPQPTSRNPASPPEPSLNRAEFRKYHRPPSAGKNAYP